MYHRNYFAKKIINKMIAFCWIQAVDEKFLLFDITSREVI